MANLVIRRCGYCDGRGEIDVGQYVPNPQPCLVCGEGHGGVRVPSNYSRCRICGGTGRRYVGEFLKHPERCGNCQGTGWAAPPPVYK